METLTRVLARHVYNLDLTDLPLDRLIDQKKRGRRLISRTEGSIHTSMVGHMAVSRQDSSLPDGNIFRKKTKIGMTRSYSETSLNMNRRALQRRRNVGFQYYLIFIPFC